LSSYYKVLVAAGGWGWLFLLSVAMSGLVYSKIKLDYTIGEWVSLKDEEADSKF
jgi:hypothetical protein